MKEKIQKWWKCLWVIWKDIRCWFLLQRRVSKQRIYPKPNGIILIKLVKQSETTFFALSSFNNNKVIFGIYSSSFFFNLIYLYISNRCASKLWVVLPPRTRVSLILTRGDTLVATFYLFYFLLALANSPKKLPTSKVSDLNHQPYTFLKKITQRLIRPM